MNACFAAPNALAVALAALIIIPQLSAISVWINEFHYDNNGGDVGEFVEIAGVAGTDLSLYSLMLYNGNNGESYGNISLSGLVPDESNGFGALSFLKSGIENGSPDGLYLSGPSGSQFLSYEGSFTASNGAANGLLSTDIGLDETSSTPIGQSLQLTGLGTEYADFSWTGPAFESPGTLNSGQSMPQPTGSTSGASSVPDNGSSGLLITLALSGLLVLRRMI